MAKIILNAYAKINLFLDVESLRNDGYHNILSIMQSISLHDTIEIEYEKSSKKEISVFCDNSNIPQNSSNIAYRAADIMVNSGIIKINITKKIPSPSGLAGGSADAGATISGLSQLLGIKYDKKILKEIGADVPFCTVGGSKIVRGIGDILEDAPNLTNCYIVVACKGEGMSTPYAYKLLDEKYDKFKSYKAQTGILDEIRCCLKQKSIPNKLFNIFENDISRFRPNVSEIKEIMLLNGVISASMSGSGPSVFGIFDDRQKAEKTKFDLLNKGALSEVCTPCNFGTSITGMSE